MRSANTLAPVMTFGVAVALAAATLAAQQQAPPRFTSTVEVTSVDVGVVDDRGRPITDLMPSDFTVRIDGDQRKVIAAEWVPLVSAETEKARQAAPPPEGYSSNENSTGGRLIVLAIDQPNIRPGGTQAMLTAAGTFIDKLLPSDRVAIVGFGVGTPATPFLADRDRLKQAISRMIGEKRADGFGGQHNISASEALAIARGDQSTYEYVVNRECQMVPRRMQAVCRSEIEAEASDRAQEGARGSADTIRALSNLLTGLKAIEGPKTLLVVSEGFMTTDGGALVSSLGGLAAASRTTLYALQLANLGDASDNRTGASLANDQRDQRFGLEQLAQVSRGALFTINGSGAGVFDRIQSELAGYYLLGVESNPRDSDGKAHPIRIDVSRRGAIVRTRRQALNAAVDAPVRSPRQAVTAALSSPLLASALPLRVTAFPLQGPESAKVQLLIHADIGVDYSASAPISVGYLLIDRTGKAIESNLVNSRLSPVMNGVPSALQFTAGASVPPGDYTLKIVASDGERTGGVEHPVQARLVEAGNVTFSELIAGGPTDDRERLSPTVGYTVSYGLLHGYLEAYGPQVEAVTVRYEVGADVQSPPLLAADAPGRLIGDDRMIFTLNFLVGRLPPGKYVLRAKVSAATKLVRTFTRAFELAAPSVLLTSAEGTGTPPVDAGLFLPVDEGAFARPFRRDDALAPEALKPFRARVAESVKADFESGVAFLNGGDYLKAEASFKRAIQPDVDSTTPLAYLAATFAASGHDFEAASAWQTALADGADLPQIYEWLSQVLLRTHNVAEAHAILTEALGKWPSDPRFTGPGAATDAVLGNGHQAMLLLERYLAARSDDVESLGLGVEWIYQTHLSGQVVHTQAEDVKLAHGYADAYTKAGGLRGALVRQWVDFLDKEKR